MKLFTLITGNQEKNRYFKETLQRVACKVNWFLSFEVKFSVTCHILGDTKIYHQLLCLRLDILCLKWKMTGDCSSLWVYIVLCVTLCTKIDLISKEIMTGNARIDCIWPVSDVLVSTFDFYWHNLPYDLPTLADDLLVDIRYMTPVETLETQNSHTKSTEIKQTDFIAFSICFMNVLFYWKCT